MGRGREREGWGGEEREWVEREGWGREEREWVERGRERGVERKGGGRVIEFHVISAIYMGLKVKFSIL